MIRPRFCTLSVFKKREQFSKAIGLDMQFFIFKPPFNWRRKSSFSIALDRESFLKTPDPDFQLIREDVKRKGKLDLQAFIFPYLVTAKCIRHDWLNELSSSIVIGQGALCRTVVTWYKTAILERKLRSGTSKTKQVNLNFLCFRCPNGQFAFQYGGFCTMWSLFCKGPIVLVLLYRWIRAWRICHVVFLEQDTFLSNYLFPPKIFWVVTLQWSCIPHSGRNTPCHLMLKNPG